MSKYTGFGLIETLIATLIALTLAIAASAGFRPLFDRFRVSTACADFRAALSMTRIEAMRRRQRVDLLPAARGDWRSGWIVAIDANNNQQLDVGDVVLHVSPAPESVEINARLTDGKAYIAFDPGGHPRTVANADQPQFGSVMFRAGEQRRKLVIGFLGRLRSCDPDRDGAAC